MEHEVREDTNSEEKETEENKKVTGMCKERTSHWEEGSRTGDFPGKSQSQLLCLSCSQSQAPGCQKRERSSLWLFSWLRHKERNLISNLDILRSWTLWWTKRNRDSSCCLKSRTSTWNSRSPEWWGWQQMEQEYQHLAQCSSGPLPTLWWATTCPRPIYPSQAKHQAQGTCAWTAPTRLPESHHCSHCPFSVRGPALLVMLLIPGNILGP